MAKGKYEIILKLYNELERDGVVESIVAIESYKNTKRLRNRITGEFISEDLALDIVTHQILASASLGLEGMLGLCEVEKIRAKDVDWKKFKELMYRDI